MVDDDELVAASTAAMLEDLGYTVIVNHSGQEALETLQSGEEPLLLLTDQAMPTMTGLELAGQVRALKPGLPILIATGFADFEERRHAGCRSCSSRFARTSWRARSAALRARAVTGVARTRPGHRRARRALRQSRAGPRRPGGNEVAGERYRCERAALGAHFKARIAALIEAWRAAIAADPKLTTNESLPRAQLVDHFRSGSRPLPMPCRAARRRRPRCACVGRGNTQRRGARPAALASKATTCTR